MENKPFDLFGQYIDFSAIPSAEEVAYIWTQYKALA
jgi:hypothetical protein